MTGKIAARLHELGIILPEPATPIANYIPFNVAGKLVVISGQIPLRDGHIAYTGKLGEAVSIETGIAAAKLCFINLVAQLLAAAGDLDRVKQVVRPCIWRRLSLARPRSSAVSPWSNRFKASEGDRRGKSFKV